jgi:hypothetical protein
MGMIVGSLLLLMEEEDAFWMMVAIVEDFLPASYYSPSLIGVQADQMVLFSREHEVLARLLYPLCCCSCCWIVTHIQQKDTRWRYCFTQNIVVFLDMMSY